MKNVLKLMQTALFPKRCGICGEVVEFDKDLCENCVDLPVINPPFCQTVLSARNAAVISLSVFVKSVRKSENIKQ